MEKVRKYSIAVLACCCINIILYTVVITTMIYKKNEYYSGIKHIPIWLWIIIAILQFISFALAILLLTSAKEGQLKGVIITTAIFLMIPVIVAPLLPTIITIILATICISVNRASSPRNSKKI